MKKNLILSLIIGGLILVFSSHLRAFDWGFKLGLNHAGFNISNKNLPVDYESRPLFTLGGFINFNISKRFSIQPELYLSAKGGNFFENIGGLEWKYEHIIGYLEFPLLLKYKIPFKGRSVPEIFFGPYYARKIGSNIVNIFDNGSEYMIDHQFDWEKYLKNADYGVVLGASIQLDTCLGKLILDARYSLGLANIINNNIDGINDTFGALYVFEENDKIKNKTFSIMIGLGF